VGPGQAIQAKTGNLGGRLNLRMVHCNKSLKLAIGSLLAATLAFSGCAGQQASLIPPVGGLAPNTAHATSGARTEHPLASTAALTVAGPIIQTVEDGFTMAVTQGCNGLVGLPADAKLPVVKTGLITVNTTSSTVMPASPEVGLYVQVTGTGSCSTAITATSLTLSKVPASSYCNAPVASQTLATVSPAQCASGNLLGVSSDGFMISSTNCHGRIDVQTPPGTLEAPQPVAQATVGAFAVAVGPVPIANGPVGAPLNSCIFSASSVLFPPTPPTPVR
jgi:hypothetical protein